MEFENQKLNLKETQLHKHKVTNKHSDSESSSCLISLSPSWCLSFSFLSFASAARVLCHLSSSSSVPNLYWKFKVLFLLSSSLFFVRVCVIEILPLISNSDITPFKGSLLRFNPFDFALLKYPLLTLLFRVGEVTHKPI
ncbi:hypothetical protein VNO77_21865 [Canavalia gladiata]|uniref:Uncharacterized protein n=1 Tax=Canavalia gladiata TaxID=3824 RepID=A0AAN9L507_CANGL